VVRSFRVVVRDERQVDCIALRQQEPRLAERQGKDIRRLVGDVANRPALWRILELNGSQRRMPTIVHGGELNVGFHSY
jgi:hypothetical protein